MPHQNGESLPETPEFAETSDSVREWFAARIENAADSYSKDMYTDAYGIYEKFDPSDPRNKLGFEMLNERLLEHAIRVADIGLIELALPNAAPAKRWELLTSLFAAKFNHPDKYANLSDDKIYGLLAVAESVNYPQLISDDDMSAVTEVLFARLVTYFQKNILAPTDLNSGTNNESLAANILSEFNATIVYFRSQGEYENASVNFAVKLRNQIYGTKRRLSMMCIQHSIPSPVIADFYGENYTTPEFLISRAANKTLTEFDRRYINAHLKSGAHFGMDSMVASLAAQAIEGNDAARAELLTTFENLKSLHSTFKNNNFLITTIRWAAPDIYKQLLPLLNPVLGSPADADDFLSIDFEDIGLKFQRDYEYTVREYGLVKDSILKFESLHSTAFWMALYAASTPEILPAERLELCEKFLQLKSRRVNELQSAVDGGQLNVDTLFELANRYLDELVMTHPKVDAYAEIDAFLDFIEVLATNLLCNPLMIRKIMESIHEQYQLLSIRTSRRDAFAKIEEKIKRIMEENSGKSGSVQLSVLGLDKLPDLNVRSFVKPVGGQINISKNNPYL